MYALLWGLLVSFASYFLPRLLLAFGVYEISDTISKPIFDYLQNKILGLMGNAGAMFTNAFYLTGFYDAVLITLTAYATAISIKAAKSVVIK